MADKENHRHTEGPTWLSEPSIMGIDEAGRGPVLGNMVYGCAFCSKREAPLLVKRGFADSKKLTEARRDELFGVITKDPELGWDTESLSAATISQRMLGSERTSLNVLAAEATFALIDRSLAKGVDLHEVFVDTVGDARRHESMLSNRYPSIKFTVCPKADALYPIVSAASIAAKVTRDAALREHVHNAAMQASTSYGSGYPGDPATKAWLEAHLDPVFGFPELVRFSWQTCSRLLEERAVPVRWETDDASQEGQKKLQLPGVAPSPQPDQASSGMGRHCFFRARHLQAMQTF